jgi:hypothetical protein
MSEAVAREKFHCPNCGADAHWNPSKQALVCPYCGTVSPAVLKSTGEIEEYDLVTALRNIPASQRGWKADKISVKCQSCQAISVLDPGTVAERCRFCGSAQLVPYEQIKAPISPESLLMFKVSESMVREKIRAWYGSRWFAPNKLKSGALTDTVKGIYLPYWTFDAQAHADWTAESGYHYYTTETYRDAQGNNQTRQVQHTRWVPSSGQADKFFDDQLVCASRGVNRELLGKVEQFPTTKELVAYDPGYVAGWTVEQYQIDLIAAAEEARQRMRREMEALCASQVPGDTHRNLNLRTAFGNQTFKHVLLPIWLLSFTYGSSSYQCVINGYTGEIAGKHPLSAVKIFFFVLALLIAALVLYAASNR